MKTYITPLTMIVNIKIEHSLMEVSGSDSNVNSVSISGNDYDSENVTILSRGGFWDDEE